MKDETSPLKAHLKGAIALINNRKPKFLETPSSTTIDHAVQAEIVCAKHSYLRNHTNKLYRSNPLGDSTAPYCRPPKYGPCHSHLPHQSPSDY